MSYRRAGADTGDMSKDRLFASDRPAAPPKRTGICQSCQWFNENKIARWPFALMLLFAFLCPVWIIMRAMGGITADILSGVCGLILAGYAANHFRTVLALKAEVDEYRRNNKEMRKTTGELKQEVDKLNRATEELNGVVVNLQRLQKNHEENVRQMQAVEKKLSKLGSSGIDGAAQLKKMTEHVNKAIVGELKQHEREILQKCRDGLEFGDDQEGLSEDEYLRFLEALPANYTRKFQALGEFETISGGDKVISLEEFTGLCDRFADEVGEKKAAMK